MNIFTSRDFLPEGRPHVPLLLPFWGDNVEDPDNPLQGRFERFVAAGRRHFTLTSLADADAVVYPALWRPEDNMDLAHRLSEQARAVGRHMLIFSEHDSTAPVGVENADVFRCSMLASRRRPDEFAQPAWSEDLLTRYNGGRLSLRVKSEIPVVSYCGYRAVGITSARGAVEYALGKNPQVHRLVSALGYDLIRSPGPRVRTQAIYVLSRSRLVQTNFVIRDRAFWDHVERKTGRVRNAGIAKQWRREFTDNILNSDYVLCTRGFGNFSYRLYETLCCGRIPVFVNTDCVLPYQHLIDWKRHCVWVEEDDIANIAKRVRDFHDRLTASEFEELQRANRQLWEEWLSPEGFFANFPRHFAATQSDRQKNQLAEPRLSADSGASQRPYISRETT